MSLTIIDFLFFVIIISFIIRNLRNTFYQAFLWQLKEYRLDRLLAHLKTPQGKKLIFGPITLIKWIFLIILLTVAGKIEADARASISAILLYAGFWCVLIIEALLNIKEYLTAGWRIPKFTPKIIIILTVVFFMHFLLIFTPVEYILLAPFLDKLLAPAVAILVILFGVPASLYKKLVIWRAKQKISSFKNLFVIGITGSYGKTSTKEFLATILGEKYKVAKTPASQNTDIGIAKYIIKSLRADHEVFVVEAGAYKIGEIKAICKMVHPKMGIITGINEQHIELFGSLDKTKKAKYELIDSLPDGSVAIFNGNNRDCRQMSEWAEKRGLEIIIYTTKQVNNIKSFPDHLEFTYAESNKKYKMSMPLLGTQNIENVLAAIFAARSLKMNMDEIKHGVAKITSPDKTMKLSKHSSGMALIDDSFNVNPDGVVAALKYMKLYSGKKILVLSPIIELGEAAADIHKKIGQTAAGVCDFVFLTNTNFVKSFSDGFTQASGSSQKIKVANKSSISEALRKLADKNAVVMFEGKEAGGILKQFEPEVQQSLAETYNANDF